MAHQVVTLLSRRALNTAIRIAARRLYNAEQRWMNSTTMENSAYEPVADAHRRLDILQCEREMRRYSRAEAWQHIQESRELHDFDARFETEMAWKHDPELQTGPRPAWLD